MSLDNCKLAIAEVAEDRAVINCSPKSLTSFRRLQTIFFLLNEGPHCATPKPDLHYVFNDIIIHGSSFLCILFLLVYRNKIQSQEKKIFESRRKRGGPKATDWKSEWRKWMKDQWRRFRFRPSFFFVGEAFTFDSRPKNFHFGGVPQSDANQFRHRNSSPPIKPSVWEVSLVSIEPNV